MKDFKQQLDDDYQYCTLSHSKSYCKLKRFKDYIDHSHVTLYIVYLVDLANSTYYMVTFNSNTSYTFGSVVGVFQIILYSLKVMDYSYRTVMYMAYNREPTYRYVFISLNFSFLKALYKFLLLTSINDVINDMLTYLTISGTLSMAIQGFVPYKFLGHENHKYHCKKLKFAIFNLILLFVIGLPYGSAIIYIYFLGHYQIKNILLYFYYAITMAIGLTFIVACYLLRFKQLNLSLYPRKQTIRIILVFACASLLCCSISLYSSFKTTINSQIYDSSDPATKFCTNLRIDSKFYNNMCHCTINPNDSQIEQCSLNVNENEETYLMKIYRTSLISVLLQVIPFSFLFLVAIGNFILRRCKDVDRGSTGSNN